MPFSHPLQNLEIVTIHGISKQSYLNWGGSTIGKLPPLHVPLQFGGIKTVSTKPYDVLQRCRRSLAINGCYH